ncbi:uncharacterized protein LOC100881670 isoform X1 [Megachile rotundata]|uniref:uncharacterized protein LOC100881670 isoform X1 n=1 Tax=Megachile rotundata TaxID=143995 RepID=UPI003FD150AD
MADDPNRDILPVREGSCPDTCRSSIDPRERHLVFKLDRYELEDKYLRLFEEAKNLKKLSNCQEDKIKRLATKLMRVASNPRACNVSLNVYDDKNRIIALELENTKLKDKITALRNQLLSHKISSRSSSRSHNAQARPSSGRISLSRDSCLRTCRSESSRTKIPSCHCLTETGDNEAQNNLETIEALTAEKKEMANRIAELEKEVSDYAANDQRVKAAENIEYIKVWRQMKQLDDKLTVSENRNKLLDTEIDDLKWRLEEATKQKDELTAALMEEKKRITGIDEELLKAKESQYMLREKEEQINDLMNEMKILQQHNNELVELSSKRGEIEQENMELKRKVSEQLQDQETLKNAFNSEQANIVALKTSNEQLLEKLQELQKNIDNLTVQFTSFQTQTEKQETTKTTQISTKQNDMQNPQIIDKPDSYKNTASQVERCKKCCEAFEKILQLEENICVTRKNANSVDKCLQTEFVARSDTESATNPNPMTPLKENPKKEEPVKETAKEPKKESAKEPVKDNVERIPTENPLTPEKMLKLLEQAQINTSPDSVRFAQKDMIGNVDYNLLDLNQRHSDTEKLVQPNPASQLQSTKQQQESNNPNPTQPPLSQFTDPNKILCILCNILQGYTKTHLIGDGTIVCPPISPDYRFIKDINNNAATKDFGEKYTNTVLDYDVQNKNVTSNILQVGCSGRRYCASPYERPRSEKLRKRTVWGTRKRDRFTKFNEISQDCTCNNSMKCNINSSCEQRCCSDNPLRSITEDVSNVQKNTSPNIPSCFKKNEKASKTLSATFIPRKLQDDDDTNPYSIWGQHAAPIKMRDTLDSQRPLQEYIEQLQKCKELVNQSRTLSNAAGIPMKENREKPKEMRCRDVTDGPEPKGTESYCNPHCPNECIDALSSLSDSFPLVIPEGQGLLELHIVSLQLSTCAKQILYREANIDNVSLFVSWDIWNQETTYTPSQKCPKLNFNSSFVYRISNLFSFFNYVLLEFVVFHVNVTHENSDDYTVSKGKLCIKDILDYPQNKLHYIAPVNSVLPCSLGMNFGQLSLWVRLSCDVKKVDRFKNTRGILTDHRSGTQPRAVVLPPPVVETPVRTGLPAQDDIKVLKDANEKSRLLYEPSKDVVTTYKQTDYLNESSDTTDVPEDNTTTFSKIPLTVMKESEEEAHSRSSFENARLALQVQRSIKVDRGESDKPLPTHDFQKSVELRTASHSIPGMIETNSSNHRTSVEEFKSYMSTENQETMTPEDSNESISEITNVLSEKNWEEYKRRSVLTFAHTRKSNGEPDKEHTDDDELTDDVEVDTDTISIDILSMILFPKSSLITNDEVQLLYIEYSFLGYAGADMETMSVMKPRPPETKLFYNFRRKFKVDEETHAMQNSMLRAMLDGSTNPNIRFIVVSEPFPEETDIKECVEVGFANFNLKEYAFGDTEKVVSIQVHSSDGTEQIGLLKILVSGINTIRQRLGRRESNL